MKRVLKAAVLLPAAGAGSVIMFNHNYRSAKLQEGPAVSPNCSREILTPPLEDMTLRNVQLFFRHGARTPLRHMFGVEEVVYDKQFILAPVPYTEIPLEIQSRDGGPRPSSKLQDKYSTIHFKGGVIAGQLTALGREQAYELGLRLATRYRDLAGDKFDPKKVHVQSTNIDRCIQSLGCTLAGLYGQSSFRADDPVIVRVCALANEIMIPRPHLCPALELLSMASFDIYSCDPGVLDVFNKIQTITGDTTGICEFDIMQIRDHIVARKAHGLMVPDFLEEMYVEIDRAAVAALMACVCVNLNQDGSYHNDPLGLSLSIGTSLEMVKERLMRFTNPSTRGSEPTMSLYCCHDSSIAPLLCVLGCFDNEWPPYSADIAIELYEDGKKQHWVKVKYCDKEMKLRGCGDVLVTLDEFLNILKPYSLTEKQHSAHCNSMNKAMKQFAGHDKQSARYELPPTIK